MKKYLILLYLAGAVVTFGHAWNRVVWYRYADPGAQLIGSLADAALFPLYWSTVAWRETP